ncbi:hypothetical protein [Mesorhizobium sp.]|uniref:hypothetical protein n=1 Tax=Mesorhizobium sp. TaxID=1871066 RepID=UPI000FE8D89E|nr:MAG: hypothetical protein EOR48_10710 [Mesorhizobium sp.]TIP42452.1 MAG: hypothetical protein E5X62_21845 [Mesorhizobium sp.]
MAVEAGTTEGARRIATQATRGLPQRSIVIAFCGGLGFMISHVLDPADRLFWPRRYGLAIIAAAARHVAFALVVLLIRPSWRGWWCEV